MKKILIIDNLIDQEFWGAQEFRRYAALAPGVTFHVRRAPQLDLPRSMRDFDKLILTGSKTSPLVTEEWVERLLELLREAKDLQKPVLGICFGHQILGRLLGGMDFVGLGKKREHGWTKFWLKDASVLTRGLPQEFHSFANRQDEVFQLPPKCTWILESKDCPIQGFEYQEGPLFGIQFHPERSQSSQPSRHFNPKIGETVFGNFLNL